MVEVLVRVGMRVEVRVRAKARVRVVVSTWAMPCTVDILAALKPEMRSWVGRVVHDRWHGGGWSQVAR